MDLPSEKVAHWVELAGTAVAATFASFFAFLLRVRDTERQVQANTKAIAGLADIMSKHADEAERRDIAIAELKTGETATERFRIEIMKTLEGQGKDIRALTRSVFRAIGNKLNYEAED